MKITTACCIIFLLATLGTPVISQAMSFTYQGQLRQSGEPFTGMADLEFRLYDQLTSGSQIGSTQSLNAVPVEDGLFKVELDFGSTAFDGSDRYLEVTVDGAPLIPRQKVSATPYALLATGLVSGSVGGDSVDSSEVQLRVVGTCPVGQSIRIINENGSVVCAVGGVTGNAWVLNGNTGTDPSTDFLGTTDDTPLVLRSANAQALRIEPSTVQFNGLPITANIIAGSQSNEVIDGARGATIGGGGVPESNADPDYSNEIPNRVSDDYSTVGGGFGNLAGNADGDPRSASFSIVGGGLLNRATGAESAIVGGIQNVAHASRSVIGGGESNQTFGRSSTVGGGELNQALGDRSTVSGGIFNFSIGNVSAIGGGEGNEAEGTQSVVGGGLGNRSTGQRSAIGGGSGNEASGSGSAIAGGGGNSASGSASAIGGGTSNEASGQESNIGGGSGNLASGTQSTVAGGVDNVSSNFYSTVGGGTDNEAIGSQSGVGGGSSNVASGLSSTVGGGTGNAATGASSTVSGGISNDASGSSSVVSGGSSNEASGSNSAVTGGRFNCAGGINSWAGGEQAKVRTNSGSSFPSGTACNNVPDSGDVDGDEGTFVWADSTNTDFISSGPNQFLVRAEGGVAFGRTPDDYFEIQTPFSEINGNGSGEQGAFRVRLDGATRLRLLGNGGLAVGSSFQTSGVPDNGLRVAGEVRLETVNGGGSTQLCLNTSSNEIATCSSSARYKDKIATLDLGLEDILALRPVSYRWTNDGSADIGFVAEEVAEIDERLIHRNDRGEVEGVRYDRISALLANGTRTLDARTRATIADLNEIRTENERLQARLANVEDDYKARVAALEKQQQQELSSLRQELALLRQLVTPRMAQETTE